MNDQSTRTSTEPTVSTTERATRQLMIKRIAGGIAPRPDLRTALRELLAEASTTVEPTVPTQQARHD